MAQSTIDNLQSTIPQAARIGADRASILAGGVKEAAQRWCRLAPGRARSQSVARSP